VADQLSSGPADQGEPTARFRSVSAELESIFGNAADAAPSGGGRSAVRIVTPRAGSERVRSLRVAHGLALLAILAAGVAAAALWPSRSAPPSPPAAIAAVPPQRAPVVMTLAAKAVPETAAAAEPPRSAEAVKDEVPPHRKASSSPRIRRAAARPLAPEKRAAVATRDPCVGLGGAERSRCRYPEVLAADRRLRGAYADAAREGAPRSMLASYRKDWVRLRRRAHSEPDRVIEGYLSMARELGSLAAAPDARGRS
jgi:hypothetical protein